MISIYIDIQHKTWNRILPSVTFAHNVAVQETTRFTPFRLLYGSEVQTMLDAMLPYQGAKHLTTDAEEFSQRTAEARQLARLHIGQQQHA